MPNEGAKFERRQKRIANAEGYLADLKLRIEKAEADLQTTPMYNQYSSTIQTNEYKWKSRQIDQLKKELEDNKDAVQCAEVDPEMIDDVMSRMTL